MVSWLGGRQQKTKTWGSFAFFWSPARSNPSVGIESEKREITYTEMLIKTSCCTFTHAFGRRNFLLIFFILRLTYRRRWF